MDLVFRPSDFVAVFNQTLEYAYPIVAIEGEVANLRVSRGKWVYFDIKDETSSLKCFGTVYVLPGPLEDGMVVRIAANPRLHSQYNFSLNLQSITPVGEGSLKRAADLLQAKLQNEGLFDPARKRTLPHAPQNIGLITAKQSAAYADFVKILNERWVGVNVVYRDSQVQGDAAPADLVKAIEDLNQLAEPLEVLVITRGGGSAEDLAGFNNESVVRAVATSRVPTMVAIGHEVDFSLAELAADVRASTPSNAAELLTPDKKHVLEVLATQKASLKDAIFGMVKEARQALKQAHQDLDTDLGASFSLAHQMLQANQALLQALNPELALQRGYAVLRLNGKVVKSTKFLKAGTHISLQLSDGDVKAVVE